MCSIIAVSLEPMPPLRLDLSVSRCVDDRATLWNGGTRDCLARTSTDRGPRPSPRPNAEKQTRPVTLRHSPIVS
jgi:hypothetical protein